MTRHRLAALLLGLSLAIATPAVVSAEVASLNGCDVLLTAPDGSELVQLARAGDDGWIEEPVVEGIVDLTANGTGQLAPGTWTATWEDGSSETFVLDCVPPPINEDQDPAETDPCFGLLPDEHVEGCDPGILIAAGVEASNTGVVSADWLPETSTEQPDDRPIAITTVLVLVIVAAIGGAIGAHATRRPR